MAEIPDSLRALVDYGPLAHVATVNSDASPQVSVVWVGWDGGDLVSGHLRHTQKARNVRRNPRAIVSLEAPRVPGVFLADHAVLDCTASIDEGGAWDLLDRLSRIYVAPDAVFPAPKTDGGYVIRYRINKIAGVGPWASG